MTAQIILPAVFTLIGVLIGAVLQYMTGRALEAKRQFMQQRGQSYVDYFKAIALIAKLGPTPENLSLAADAKTRICIYGSPKVVAQLGLLEVSGPNTTMHASQKALISLISAMRTDLGNSLGNSEENTLQAILFGSR
jgi:hypothetical protein